MELYKTFTEDMMIGATLKEVYDFLSSVGYQDPWSDWNTDEDLGLYGEVATADYWAPIRFVFDFEDGAVIASYFEECEE